MINYLKIGAQQKEAEKISTSFCEIVLIVPKDGTVDIYLPATLTLLELAGQTMSPGAGAVTEANGATELAASASQTALSQVCWLETFW
jgi:hypothetical protein